MSETIKLVWLVRRGQGYARVDLTELGVSIYPGQMFEAAPRIAAVILEKFPGQVVRVTDEPLTVQKPKKKKEEG